MRFEWDGVKAKVNFTKHGVLFETAALVFEDPSALTRLDAINSEQEQRYITLGLVDQSSILFVVHTYEIKDEQEVARIISARVATRKERKLYEKAHDCATAKSRRH